MESNILMWIGYAASVIIALSMTMNSIVKFRWINLIGAFTFATYGILIGAFPVGALNGFIVVVDIYYLAKIYSKKHLFDILEIREDNKYLIKFLDYYNDDIQKFLPDFEYNPSMNSVSFFVLRNTAVAGIFLAHRENNNELKVGLDYVVPEYRDFKNGKFVYNRLKDYFIKEGYQKVVAESGSRKHTNYLKKVGFIETKNGVFIKEF
jgi:hypothetical protein